MQRLVQRAWEWLREGAIGHDVGPRVFIGCRSGDPSRTAQLMLLDVRSSDRIATLPGDHDWTVWAELFDVLAERALSTPADASPR